MAAAAASPAEMHNSKRENGDDDSSSQDGLESSTGSDWLEAGLGGGSARGGPKHSAAASLRQATAIAPLPAKGAAGEASFERSMLDHSAKIAALCAHNGIESVIPHDIIIGSQGAGKTSFLEALIHFPLGGRDDADRVGNVGPVRYALTHNRDITTPIVRIRYPHGCGHRNAGDVVDISCQELHKKLAEWRDRVQDKTVVPNSNGFTTCEITVEIHSPFVPSYVVVDMPGLQSIDDNDHPAAMTIARCMAQLARLDMYGIVAVNPLPDNTDTAFGLGLLNRVMTDDSLFSSDSFASDEFEPIPPPRDDWKKHAMIVFTKADAQFSGIEIDFGKMANYFESFGEAHNGDGGFSIVSLNPRGVNKDKLNFDEAVAHLGRLHKDEVEFFETAFSRLHGVPAHVDRARYVQGWKSNCTLKLTTKRIQDRLLRRFVRALPVIANALEELLAQKRLGRARMDKLCQVTTADEQFAQVTAYVADFVEHYHALLIGGITNGLHHDAREIGGIHVKKHGPRAVFDANTIGMTIKEEMRGMSDSPQPFEQPARPAHHWDVEEEKERKTRHYLPQNDHDLLAFVQRESREFAKNSGLRLTGIAAMERWIEVFRKVLLARKCIPLTVDSIRQMCPGNSVDVHNIVRTAVTVQFDCARQGLTWLQHKLHWQLEHYEKLVHKHLLDSPKYASLRPVGRIVADLVHQGVSKMRDALLAKLVSEWSEEVQRRHFNFNINHIAHTMIALVKTPWRLIPLHPYSTRPQDFRGGEFEPFERPYDPDNPSGKKARGPHRQNQHRHARSSAATGTTGPTASVDSSATAATGTPPPPASPPPAAATSAHAMFQKNYGKTSGGAGGVSGSSSPSRSSAGGRHPARGAGAAAEAARADGLGLRLSGSRDHDVELAVAQAFDPESLGQVAEQIQEPNGPRGQGRRSQQWQSDPERSAIYKDMSPEIRARLAAIADKKVSRALDENFSEPDLQRILLSHVICQLSQSFNAFSIDNMHDLNLLVFPPQYHSALEMESQLDTINGYVEQFYRFTMFELSTQFSMYAESYVFHPLKTCQVQLLALLTLELETVSSQEARREYLPPNMEKFLRRREQLDGTIADLVARLSEIKALQRRLAPEVLPMPDGFHPVDGGQPYSEYDDIGENVNETLDEYFDSLR